jgi:hypothetical protein
MPKCRYGWDLMLYPNEDMILERVFREVREAYQQQATAEGSPYSILSPEEIEHALCVELSTKSLLSKDILFYPKETANSRRPVSLKQAAKLKRSFRLRR